MINMTEAPEEKDAAVIKTKSGQKTIRHLNDKMDYFVIIA